MVTSYDQLLDPPKNEMFQGEDETTLPEDEVFMPTKASYSLNCEEKYAIKNDLGVMNQASLSLPIEQEY